MRLKLELTCRQRVGCPSHHSCKLGSLESCRNRAHIGHSFHLQNPPSIYIGQSVHHKVLAQLLWHGSDSACIHGRGGSSTCLVHTVHKHCLPSVWGKHNDQCPGRRCGRVDCKAGTACIPWRRCPRIQPDKRRTGVHPLPACTDTGQSHRHSHCSRPPLGRRHKPCSPCLK